MTAFIDENQQFIDPDTSVPIVNGEVFFGQQGADPELVPIDVFTDRGLTPASKIDQPVKTDDSGRTVQKIFIPGRYSFKVKNSAGSQRLIDLDAGSIEAVGTTILTNIGGSGNVITAQADPVITSLVNGEQFTFTAIAINTDKMTLDIDGLGARPIKFNFSEEMAPGFIQEDRTVVLTFNSTTNSFDWSNDGRGISLLTSVAGAANAITANGGPSATGNYVNQQLYSFKPAFDNTGAVTLNINGIGATAIRNLGVSLSAGRLKVGITYIVSYDSVDDVFELVNSNNLSAPGKIGDVTANTIKGTTGEFTTSIKAATGATITAFDTGTLDSSDTKVPTNNTVLEALNGAGRVLQIVNVEVSAIGAVTTNQIPTDNTIPQSTEGVQVMSLAITPKSATSKLIIQVIALGSGDQKQPAADVVMALFRDSGVNAIAATLGRDTGNESFPFNAPLSLTKFETSGSTSPTTYKVHLGPSISGRNVFFNASGNAAVFGTAPKSSMMITEVGV